MSDICHISYTAFEAIEQGDACTLDASGQVIKSAAATDLCVGIATTSAEAGDCVTLRVFGVTEARVNATTTAVLAGGELMCTGGALVAYVSGAGVRRVAQALKPVAVGENKYALVKLYPNQVAE